MKPPFTPTERRILVLLGDGLPHTKEEIHGCLNDELQPLTSIHVHIMAIRAKLPVDTEIICQLVGGNSKSHAFRLIRVVRLVPEELCPA